MSAPSLTTQPARVVFRKLVNRIMLSLAALAAVVAVGALLIVLV